jgi:mRNA interferase RelE/StbE
MAKYEVVITTSVQKYLDKLPDKLADKLEKSMMKLEDNPRPLGSEKMSGKNAYRIRVGDYRIIYTIQDKVLLITVINAGHRRDIYRK